LRTIYEIPIADFERRRDAYIELLELEDLVTKPVRNLSLGERMKVELAAALLHQPEVIFLDEPTIGLDLTMQRRLRKFVLEYNRENGATVLLTSHYMADVVAMAERVIVIHHGTILYDGNLSGLAASFGGEKTITINAPDLPADLGGYGVVTERSADRVTMRVTNTAASAVAARLLGDFDVSDVTIEDPPIEDVIERVFATGRDEA
jgi:ABC-2 type transport system ATP-binding protein